LPHHSKWECKSISNYLNQQKKNPKSAKKKSTISLLAIYKITLFLCKLYLLLLAIKIE